MIGIFVLIILSASIYIFLYQPPFGKTPAGERLNKIKNSPNFSAGRFQNISPTPDLTEGASYLGVMNEFLFKRNQRGKPSSSIPARVTDLAELAPGDNTLVWFGHSSYFLQVDGIKILVDPVLSGSASPVSFTTKSFSGSDAYSADQLPGIDYLLITHDHWDHLDYNTLLKLRNRIKKIVCGLGVGQHLERWGFDPAMIIEKDWNETEILAPGFTLHALPARHFSGRGLRRNKTLWVSYALMTPSMKIYFGGDSGYDTHFKTIGEAHGPFDLAILECGQYDRNWKYIHMRPTEVIEAGMDLRAKKIMPVHWGKFGLANHSWDDPIIEVVGAAKEKNVSLVTPMIGEAVKLNGDQLFKDWWTTVR